jgi:hypothetical protein
MAYKKWILRILRVAGLAALGVVLLAFAAVQFQQWMLRWRAERLMADMRQIRLYQSTWADAQRLMNRWGAWGHYDGSCTATECRYEIELTDASGRALETLRPSTFDWLMRFKAYTLYSWLGGRYSIVQFAFIVQDGAILRTKFSVDVQVPPKLLDFEDGGYVLIVEARSQQALRPSGTLGDVRGGEDQLAEHPYYKARRPDGCTFCMMVKVNYSTYTPQSEIVRLTSFDFSCLTRLISCKMPEDLLPAAREWHLYSDSDPSYQAPPMPASPPKPCDIPIWAIGRDAISAFVVEAVPTAEQEQAARQIEESEDDFVSEAASVRIVEQLKGSRNWPTGAIVEANTFPGRHFNPPPELPEHLSPGKRYILLTSSVNDGHAKELNVDRCGVQEDTPEVRRELEKGFAQNDNLRGPELR